MAKQQIAQERNWYVIHTYSGYEDAVSRNLKQRIESLDMGDKIFQVHCPSCHFFYMVIREEIDPDAGDIMQCPTCENLSYVPGSYRTKRRPYYDLPITGGCLVPLEQIREWFLSHPLVRQWTERGEHKNFTEYGGFFAYCSRCYYQLNQRQFNTMIGINARRRLYCCRNTSLIVILVEKGSPEESTFPNTVTVGA